MDSDTELSLTAKLKPLIDAYGWEHVLTALTILALRASEEDGDAYGHLIAPLDKARYLASLHEI